MHTETTHISNISHVALRRALETHQFLVRLVAEPVARLDLHHALPALLEAGTFDPHAGPFGRKPDQIRHRSISAYIVFERTADASPFGRRAYVDRRQFSVTGIADLTSVTARFTAVASPARFPRLARVLAALATLAVFAGRSVDGSGGFFFARKIRRRVR